ncbi:MAG TPA: FkbM family methyltransferase [Fimbriimonadaceae bacterium]|nr:FkbM family methyltransferase [Fimbriimonadaceae bacterium]
MSSPKPSGQPAHNPAFSGVAGSLARWVRKNQSNPLIKNVIKPLARKIMMPGWKKQSEEFFRSLVKPGDLVFDVGAHTGEKAELFLRAGAKVVCFEPQADLASTMRQKFEGRKDVVVLEKGLSAEEGTIKFYLCPEDPTIATASSEWKEGTFSDKAYSGEVEISVTTLEAMIREHGVPDFVKIDVEGFEIEVLRGLHRPLPLLSIEWAKDGLKNTFVCIDRLVELGFKEFNVSLGETGKFVFDEWVSADALVSYLNGPLDQIHWGDIYAKS